ncbi:MAG: hypothetical protein AAF740_01285 [Bacteroidota bacterium]
MRLLILPLVIALTFSGCTFDCPGFDPEHPIVEAAMFPEDRPALVFTDGQDNLVILRQTSYGFSEPYEERYELTGNNSCNIIFESSYVSDDLSTTFRHSIYFYGGERDSLPFIGLYYQVGRHDHFIDDIPEDEAEMNIDLFFEDEVDFEGEQFDDALDLKISESDSLNPVQRGLIMRDVGLIRMKINDKVYRRVS